MACCPPIFAQKAIYLLFADSYSNERAFFQFDRELELNKFYSARRGAKKAYTRRQVADEATKSGEMDRRRSVGVIL